ncbi:MAG: hypothetical protein Alpg2KO_26060 [Alphaproteobacteria bacterium]
MPNPDNYRIEGFVRDIRNTASSIMWHRILSFLGIIAFSTYLVMNADQFFPLTQENLYLNDDRKSYLFVATFLVIALLVFALSLFHFKPGQRAVLVKNEYIEAETTDIHQGWTEAVRKYQQANVQVYTGRPLNILDMVHSDTSYNVTFRVQNIETLEPILQKWEQEFGLQINRKIWNPNQGSDKS